MHQLDADLDGNELKASVDGLIATMKPYTVANGWDTALSQDNVEARAEWALNFLTSVLLSKVGPDPFETHGDRLYKSWVLEDGTVAPPALNASDLVGVYKSVSEASWTKTLVLSEGGLGTAEYLSWTYAEAVDGSMSRVETCTAKAGVRATS